jgi:pyrimidine operon attenuation protein / uracil phosphoribosyltransferase
VDSHVLIGPELFERIIDRLAHQLLEHHDFSQTDLIGLQPRGIRVAERLQKRLQEITGNQEIQCAGLDATFHRDDFRLRNEPITPSETTMEFLADGRKVILVDDVLFTGRTIRAGLDALMAYGRPGKVELLVLIDRRFRRELPIEPQYVGRTIDSIDEQYVRVEWSEETEQDRVVLFNVKPI